MIGDNTQCYDFRTVASGLSRQELTQEAALRHTNHRTLVSRGPAYVDEQLSGHCANRDKERLAAIGDADRTECMH